MTSLVSAIQRSLSAPSQSTANLCEYCLQQPKFQNHPYCSKTCAGQAAFLCDHCHKKPKFQGFEYCGKNCASMANPDGRRGGAQRHNPTLKWPSQPKGNRLNAPRQTMLTVASFDPSQVPNFGVVQQIPRVQTGPAPNYSANDARPPVYQMGAPMAVTHPTGKTTWIPRSNNPSSSNAPNMTSGSFIEHPSNSIPVSAPSRLSGNVGRLSPGGKPVYVGGNGSNTSQISSMRHREEGVASDSKPSCIMCLVKPQSEDDYFCGRACREESMDKNRSGGNSPTDFDELPDFDSPTT